MGSYYINCYDCKLTTVDLVNGVACTTNIFMAIIDDSMFVNTTSRVINYALRMSPQFGATL
jgi:hypothetical protein